MNVFLESLSHLSDSKLLDHLDSLVARDRRTTADLLMAIAEIDERKLWANEACSSMFVFCVRRAGDLQATLGCAHRTSLPGDLRHGLPR